MGSVERLKQLRASVASIRESVGKLSYVCLIAVGGRDDGTRDWLRGQSDCEMLEGGLDGAVPAYNRAYARAVALGSPWPTQFNDDLTFSGGGLEIERAVDMMKANESIGAVAFGSDRYSPGKPNCEWMRYHGKCYCNQGVFRREAGMAVARFLGDPEGKRWWDVHYHTYAADTILGLSIWRLGWRIHEAPELSVHDPYASDNGHLDPLRIKNSALYTNGDLFLQHWGDPKTSDYHREDAERFGGRIL